MNRKGNQRTVQTENKIRWVFLNLLVEKELKNISVSEICKKAGIHRTTFYVHYQDVADLMEHMVADMYLQVKDMFVDEEEGMRHGGFKRLFELVSQHRTFFSAYINAAGTLELNYDKLPAALQENIDRVMPILGYTSREELLYHQTFFCEGLSAVIRRWIRGGCKESPEEMERIIVSEYKNKTDLAQKSLFSSEKVSDS